MQTKFEFFGDELRYLVENKSKIRQQLISSFFENIKDIIVEHLRNNVNNYPKKGIEIIISSLFSNDNAGMGVPHFSFYGTLREPFTKLAENNGTFPTTPTSKELDWYGVALESYFRSQKLTATYNENNSFLHITWK